MSSCVDRIDLKDLNVSESGDELVLTSLITPDAAVEASVAISHSLYSDSQISYPEQAEIELMGTGLQGSNLRFTYKSSSNRYILRNQQFRPSVGGEYQIRAYVPGSEVDTILATTTIPSKIKIANAVYSNQETEVVNDAYDYFLDLSIEIEESEVLNSWLQIIPTYKTNISDDNQRFEIIDIVDNKNAVNELYLEEGVFVDMTKMSGNTINIRVSTLIPVKPGALIKTLHFETRSVTKDYFQFHKKRALQGEVSDQPFLLPITDFTNVENGLGVFAGYTTSSHKIKF